MWKKRSEIVFLPLLTIATSVFQYVKVAAFLTDFHVSKDSKSTLNPGEDYTDYQWWLGYTEDGSWQLLTWGY